MLLYFSWVYLERTFVFYDNYKQPRLRGGLRPNIKNNPFEFTYLVLFLLRKMVCSLVITTSTRSRLLPRFAGLEFKTLKSTKKLVSNKVIILYANCKFVFAMAVNRLTMLVNRSILVV